MFRLRISLIFLVLTSTPLVAEPYFIVFLVNARKLDTRSLSKFYHSLARYPNVGHAWIYLQGDLVLEGGHSGERGIYQPLYKDGVMDHLEWGVKNPVRYLWSPQCDGFFQEGNGGHKPTFAAKVDLSKQQYEKILAFIKGYPFHEYSLTKNQCCTFLQQIASLVGLELNVQAALMIDQWIVLDGFRYQMWEDPRYSKLLFSSPDVLEASLKRLVKEGKAQNVLAWYQTGLLTKN
jgi:hypothetical protein